MALIKVVPRSLTEAYKKREGDFSPNLVGLQFTDPNAFFTFGNFQITTNLESRVSKDFVLGGEWSDYYNLTNLNVTQQESDVILSNEIFVRLNFDPNKIDRYVYFGSFYEYARVTLEQVIQKWKGSVYLNPTLNTNVPVNTVLSFNYNSGDDVSTFLIPKSVISNPFELIVDDNSSAPPVGEIYNLTFSYNKYVIWSNNKNYNVIGYTGSSDNYQYMVVKTTGNPFPTLTASTFGQFTYHLKPNDVEVELFFEELNDFEKILLNRLVTPIYTASFDVPVESEGITFTQTKSITWPTSDGYNIDINTRNYATYVENLLAIASNFDANKTDLVSRRFVSESIHEFDTNGGGDPAYGMKVTKLLKIYGREFDEVKKYIDGISFANVVTYDKLDNTSDELIKIIAKNLGFDVLLTVTSDNFNLTEQILTTPDTPFSGYSRSLSAKELDIELWRRLVINAWWLYKSKGTRKVLEFIFNLFKVPECMLTLNEYVYLASNRLDTTNVYGELQKIYNDDTFSFLTANPTPMDEYGFPLPLSQTLDNYFQNDGFWYNNGTDITTGNNPHIGPYDIGTKYFDQFRCFVPNFNDYLTGLTTVTEIKNYFTDYDNGNFGENALPIYPNYGPVINSVSTNATVTESGYVLLGDAQGPTYMVPENKNSSLKIKFNAGNSTTICEPCNYDLEYGEDGFVYKIGTPREILSDPKCCQHYVYEVNISVGLCYWCSLNPIEVCDTDTYLSYFTAQEIESYAITLGWDPINSNQTAAQFINSFLQPFFDQNGCIILDATRGINNITNISNAQCCELRGGQFIESNGNYFCVKNVVNPCSGYEIINHVLTLDGQLMSEECCTQLGFNWNGNLVDPSRIYVYSETTGSIEYYFMDTLGSGYANTYNSKIYCSACPQNLLDTVNGLLAYNPTTQETNTLSQICCQDYGFTYDGVTGKCSKCPTPSNGSTAPYEIIFSNTNNLASCCLDAGGYYYPYNTTSSKCWSCPNPTDNNITIDSVTGIITYSNVNISQQCCTSYGILTNQNVTYTNGVCKLSNSVPDPIPFSITSADIIYVTSEGKVYVRTLENRGNNATYGDYSTFEGLSTYLFTLHPDFIPVSSNSSHSITHTNNKLFVLNSSGTYVAEYDITLSPWSVSPTPVNIIQLPTKVEGLFAVSDNVLLTTNISNGNIWLVELTLTLVNSNLVSVAVNNQFKLTTVNNNGLSYYSTSGKILSLVKTSTNKIIITTRNVQDNNTPLIHQYNYGSFYIDPTYGYFIDFGGLEFQETLSPTIDYPYGIIMANTNTPSTVYLFKPLIFGDIYKIKTDTYDILNISLIGGLTNQYQISENGSIILGVSQLMNNLNNDFDIDPNDLINSPQGPNI